MTAMRRARRIAVVLACSAGLGVATMVWLFMHQHRPEEE